MVDRHSTLATTLAHTMTTEAGTTTGYALTCPQCGNPDAHSIPSVEYLNGVGEGGLVKYTHTIRCATCDATA